MKFNPENKETLTYGEALGPAMEIINSQEAQEYLKDYSAFIQKYLDEEPDTEGRTAEQVARINLGYYAGYYDYETQARVQRLFLAAHPVFGSL